MVSHTALSHRIGYIKVLLFSCQRFVLQLCNIGRIALEDFAASYTPRPFHPTCITNAWGGLVKTCNDVVPGHKSGCVEEWHIPLYSGGAAF